MVRFQRLCLVGLMMYIVMGTLGCGEKLTSDVATVDEKNDLKEEAVIEDVSQYVVDEGIPVQDVSTDVDGKTINTLKGVSPVDEDASDTFSVDERILIIPDEEDIPESIKKVFIEYAEFDVIFDLGSDVICNEKNGEVELSIYYFSPKERGRDIYHITTNLKEYDYGEPHYSETWNFPIYWRAYRVMDLDSDGINELIYIVSPRECTANSDDYYIIFHEIEGKAYAYASNLYCNRFTEDGMMTIGHGTKDYLYRIKSFDTERFYIDCVLYMYDSEGEWKYILNGKQVTSDEGYDYYKDNYLDKDKALFKSKDGLVTLW